MSFGMITFVLGVIALATCMIKGKQWPTFLTAALFGIFLGSTFIGEGVKDFVTSFVAKF